jgi:hypothetical protein
LSVYEKWCTDACLLCPSDQIAALVAETPAAPVALSSDAYSGWSSRSRDRDVHNDGLEMETRRLFEDVIPHFCAHLELRLKVSSCMVGRVLH